MKNYLFLKSKKKEFYKNILIKADLGLHQQIAEILLKNIEKGSKILDLGAGEGALSYRLFDLGYEVIATDIDYENFKCDKVKFEKVDFNSKTDRENFKKIYESSFDVVISVEVIEHIEDQWEYIRLLKSLLKSGGFALVTTPNTTSWLSRLYFFLYGKFYQFDEGNLEYGHISPITQWELETILRKEKFQNILTVNGGTLTPIYWPISKKFRILNLLILPLRIFMKGIKDGYCIIATGTKLESKK